MSNPISSIANGLSTNCEQFCGAVRLTTLPRTDPEINTCPKCGQYAELVIVSDCPNADDVTCNDRYHDWGFNKHLTPA
jgi:hypothetical protein